MSLREKVRRRFRALFRKQELDDQMDTEMHSHVEMQTQENIEAGMKPEEARRKALMDFGAVESIKEECRDQRGVRWIEQLAQDLRYGARMLRKNPGFTAVAVLTLALGIGVNTAIFSIVNTVLLRPLPFPDGERIVLAETFRTDTGRTAGGVSGPDFLDWQTQNSVFERMAHSDGEDDLATVIGDRAVLSNARSVSADFFAVFGLPPSAGRLLTGQDTRSAGTPPTIAVVSHHWAVTHFGTAEAAIGKVIDVYRIPLRIVGVAAPGFRYPDATDIWVPKGPTNRSNRSALSYQVVGKLKPGVDLGVAQAEMRTISDRLAQQYPENRLKTVALIPLHEKMTGNVRATLWVLMGAVGLVLLIACANVSNLLIARSTSRTREIALRSALGAARSRLLRQLLTESLVLAGLAALGGLALTYLLVEGLVAMSPANLPRVGEVRIDGTILLFTLGLSFASALLFGLLPALKASRLDLTEALKHGGSVGTVSGGSGRLRTALVVIEVALSLMLLVGAGLLLRSFHALHQVDLGFTTDRVLTAYTQYPIGRGRDDRSRIAFYRDLLERVRKLPGVSAASGVAILPLGREPRAPIEYFIEGRPGERLGGRPTAQFLAITPHYLKTLEIPLRLGRDFEDTDTIDKPPVVMISESLARTSFPGESPLGRRIKTGNDSPWMEIVGVVGDTRWRDASQPPRPELFTVSAQGMGGGSLSLLVRTSLDPATVSNALRALIHDMDSTVPVRFETMAEMFAGSLAYPRFRTQLLGGFAGTALLLATLGLYGVLAYMVSQRTREIGVRVALGAQRRDVLDLVIGQGMRLALVGIALGLVGAFALSRVLQGLLYEIKPTDWLTFLAVPFLLIFAAFVACWLPARRAAKVDPMVALRTE